MGELFDRLLCSIHNKWIISLSLSLSEFQTRGFQVLQGLSPARINPRDHHRGASVTDRAEFFYFPFRISSFVRARLK